MNIQKFERLAINGPTIDKIRNLFGMVIFISFNSE